MKKLVRIAVAVALLVTIVLSVPVLAAATKVVAPEFDDHDLSDYGAILEFSDEETILGDHSVKMFIPYEGCPHWYNLGLDVNVTMPGVVRGLGLSRYKNISFKANVVELTGGWLYNGLILYDRTNHLWVSLMPDGTTIGNPDVNGWSTVTPGSPGTLTPEGEVRWSGYTFDGEPWPRLADGYAWPDPSDEVIYYPWSGPVMPLSNWDEYIDANDINVKVEKVQIKFGFSPDGGGTLYVDGLATHGFVLDFEP